MIKKKLKLSSKLTGRLKVKSFSTVLDKTTQQTAKGGYKIAISGFSGTDPWTEIKSGKGYAKRPVNYIGNDDIKTGKNNNAI